MTVYTDNGFDNRKYYLLWLSEKYDIPIIEVKEVASQLGPMEDFDGLISMCQDYHILKPKPKPKPDSGTAN